MKTTHEIRKIGIWMDHAHARFMEYLPENMEAKEVTIPNIQHHNNNHGTDQNESMVQNKEQRDQHHFYQEIGEKIKEYNEVLLFGPTDAKTELHHLLQSDHHFDKIKFEIRQADKMTENQEISFVKEYFSGH